MKSIFYGVVYCKQNHIEEIIDWEAGLRKPEIRSFEGTYFEKFHECYIDQPPLKEGDYIFLDDIEVEVKIWKTTRISSGGYKYTCDYVIRHEDMTGNIDDAMKKEYDEKLKKYETSVALLEKHKDFNKRWIATEKIRTWLK